MQTAEKIEEQFRTNDYVMCRHLGDNGDLIVGKLTQVRNKKGGLCSGENLITGKRFTKSVEVLRARNKIVSCNDARRVAARYAEVFSQTGKSNEARKAARLIACAIARGEDRPQLALVTTSPPVPVPVPAVESVLAQFRDLSVADQQLFARQVWREVLSAFGVQ